MCHGGMCRLGLLVGPWRIIDLQTPRHPCDNADQQYRRVFPAMICLTCIREPATPSDLHSDIEGFGRYGECVSHSLVIPGIDKLLSVHVGFSVRIL